MKVIMPESLKRKALAASEFLCGLFSLKGPPELAALIFCVFLFDFSLVDFVFLFIFAAFLLMWVSRAAGARERFFIWVLFLAPALMTLQAATAFATVDETVIAPELAGLKYFGFSWNMGALRTSYLLHHSLGFFINIPPWSDDVSQQIHKGLHWLVGLGLFWRLAFLWRGLVQAWAGGDERPRLSLLLGLWYLLLLNPASMVALKVLNYDLLALVLSLLAAALCLSSLTGARPALLAALAVVCAFLGAQEKLSAGPFLILSSAFFVRALFQSAPLARIKNKGRRFLASLASLALLLSSGLLAVGLWAAVFFPSLANPDRLFWGLADPLVSWTWLPAALSGVFTTKELFAWADKWLPVSLLLFLLAVSLGAAALSLFFKCAAATPRKARAALCAALALAVAFGLIYTSIAAPDFHVYMSPYHPPAEGLYVPTKGMNGSFWHFDSPDYASYLFNMVKAHLLNAFAALPLTAAALWLASLYCLGFVRKDALGELSLILALFSVIFFIGLIAYGLVGVPVVIRYKNFLLLLPALLGALTLASLPRPRANVLCGLVMAALVAEMAPHAPLYFSYASPTVAMGRARDAKMFELGAMGVNWPGWGEETMLAGRRLQKENRGPLNLFCYYSSAWLRAPENIAVLPMRDSGENNDSENDFYLFNRIGAIQRWHGVPFPVNTEPYALTAFNGYVQGWLFRGSDLKAGGDLEIIRKAYEK
ncbi:MAG: hypothetical protein LBS31_07470 [Candidatus Adiutrix sp.]|jgi:hypothetical protein|nr:hypothetical protein [Candidatus Adiutrix sp.]